MIPPNIPLSAVPVTSQYDPVRQPPAIPPVTAPQPTQGEATLEFKQRDQEESALRLHEEFQRNARQQQREQGDPDAEPEPEAVSEEAYLPIPGYELNPDDTVPVAPLIDNEPRQGLLINIEV